jgi:hypothetical protein
MRKDVREFIRRLEAVGLSVESTPGHYHVLRDGKPLRKQNGMPSSNRAELRRRDRHRQALVRAADVAKRQVLRTRGVFLGNVGRLVERLDRPARSGD